MYKISNLFENDDIRIADSKAGMKVIEYLSDLSVMPSSAITAYYCARMNVRKKQLVIELDGNEYTLSSGAMQWSVGNVEAVADVKGVGDLLGKAIKGSVTKEGTVKPKYKGTGTLVLEPTYKHILLEDVSSWNGGMVLDDGLFLACESRLKQDVVMRSNLSSAVLGNEGLFNLKVSGEGIVALESPVPREELVEVNLQNDVLKVDGNFAIAWSDSLDFTVEKSTKSLIGSAISAEGFVNVYRGTGKVLLAPIKELNYSSISSLANR
ncbi:MAG: AIM24 family protein [Clostridia bacterium]|nr:AIM24 family protein [Clostridia bacterium]